VVVRTVDLALDGARVVALQHDRLATRDAVGARDPARTRREDVLAVARRVDEQLREGLGGQRGDRLVDRGATRELAWVKAARAVADRPARAQLVGGRIGPDDLAVGDPQLVAARRPS
jgi:hypothetical protein